MLNDFDLQLFADPPEPKPGDLKPGEPKPGENPDPNVVDRDGEKLYKEKHVKDLRSEAQRNRERAEAAEKTLREREEADEKARQEQLKEEKKFEQLAEDERKKREKAEKDAADRISATERRMIRAEVKALAIAAGLEDPDDIELIDISTVKIENDKIVGAEDVVAAFKETKPHKFTTGERSRGGLDTGKPGSGGKAGDIDARNMKPEQFAELDRKLRAQK